MAYMFMEIIMNEVMNGDIDYIEGEKQYYLIQDSPFWDIHEKNASRVKWESFIKRWKAYKEDEAYFSYDSGVTATWGAPRWE